MIESTTEKYPISLRGWIYPQDDNGYILPDSEPEIVFQVQAKKELKWQEIHRKLIADHTRSIEGLQKAGVE